MTAEGYELVQGALQTDYIKSYAIRVNRPERPTGYPLAPFGRGSSMDETVLGLGADERVAYIARGQGYHAGTGPVTEVFIASFTERYGIPATFIVKEQRVGGTSTLETRIGFDSQKGKWVRGSDCLVDGMGPGSAGPEQSFFSFKGSTDLDASFLIPPNSRIRFERGQAVCPYYLGMFAGLYQGRVGIYRVTLIDAHSHYLQYAEAAAAKSERESRAREQALRTSPKPRF